MNPIGVRLTGDCPKCGSEIVVRRRRVDGEPFLSCIAYPTCKWAGDYDRTIDELSDQMMELRDENRRLRASGPKADFDIDRELRSIIAIAHPDKWPKAGALAHEITTLLNALRGRLK